MDIFTNVTAVSSAAYMLNTGATKVQLYCKKARMNNDGFRRKPVRCGGAMPREWGLEKQRVSLAQNQSTSCN